MSTTSTSSNFSSAHVDAYIRAKLLELGKRTHLWRQFVNKESLPKGEGTVWKALRYARLDVPLAALTEGTAPTETDLVIEYLTCTATQYGLTVKLTDILQLTIKHPVLQKAIELKAEVMNTLDDKLIIDQAMAGTNVFFPNAVTVRSSLTAATDVPIEATLRKVVASLRSTDGVKGRAPAPKGGSGNYACLIHEKQVFDVQAFAGWKETAYRLDKASQEKGMINSWMGCDFYATDFLPVIQNISNGMSSLTLTDATAVTDSRGVNGLKVTAAATGGTLASAVHYMKITRWHKKRGMEEGVTSVMTLPTTGGAAGSYSIVMPTSTDYVYSGYIGDTNASADLFRFANKVAGASVQSVTTLPTTLISPINPPRNTTSTTSENSDVFTAFILGGDALAVVDLDDLKSYHVKGADSANPLDQFSIVGSKFMLATCILQDAFFARIESVSAFGV